MIVEITIKDDNGNIVIPTQSGRAEQPVQWKSPYANPVIIEREGNNGAYMLFGFTYQPMITLNMNWRKQINAVIG